METNKHKKIHKSTPANKPSNKNNDKRFKAMEYDPKFIAPSKNVGKVKIDKRFSKMMSDPEFKVSSTVDKYGRVTDPDNDQREHLKDYYYREDSMEEEAPIEDEHEEDREEDRLRKWMEEYNEMSSDDIEEQAYNDLLEEEEQGIWSDDEQNVVKNQKVQATKRLALCNYDWMNINAKDLMLLFSSFKPSAGIIKSVTVYYSMYGKEKLEAEEQYGPQEIWAEQPVDDEDQEKRKKKKSWKSVLDKNYNKQSEAFDQKKLRKYEKDRLKYCYAVIECDSKKTADEIYKECDGNQFENSNLLFDLRFVPDDTKFDENLLKERSNELPVSGEVKNFINKAMGHSNVSLTWEDPELNTAAGLKKKNWNTMTEQEMNKIDWGLYINEVNEEAEQNYNKMMKKGNQKEDGENEEQVANVSDWRKECNKNYRKKKSEDDIQITFPSGFDTKPVKDHQSLNKQIKSKKERWEAFKAQKRNKQKLEMMVDKEDKKDFEFNAEDTRFKAVFENPLYSINPVDPKFDHRKVGKVFQQVVKRNKKKNFQ